jgi:signal transduction histidine kinase
MTDPTSEKNNPESALADLAEAYATRLGQDLHDGLGQMLTGILSLTEALEGQLTGPLQQDAARIRQLVKEASQTSRDMSHSLAPAAMLESGLAAALAILAKKWNHPGLTIETDLDALAEPPDLPAGTHLYRLVQEAVNNAIKHGKPKRITLTLKQLDKAHGEMSIRDDGNGFQLEKVARGLGLQLMAARAKSISGELRFNSSPGHGTDVTCRFPCAP